MRRSVQEVDPRSGEERMKTELVKTDGSGILLRDDLGAAGLVLRDSGVRARKRILEFFAARIENDNTRRAYLNALKSFFSFCHARGVQRLQEVEAVIVAAYLQHLKTTLSERTGRPLSKPTRKQHLAAIRHLFDWLVTGQVVEVNPAHSVRGPKHKVRRGKTPHMEPEQARALLDSIDTSKISGLRDRALIASMLYTFARVNAVISLKVEDFYQNGRRWWFRLEEKNGKVVEMA